MKSTYKDWVVLYRNIPQTERNGIGFKIDTLLLELLELLRKSTYTPVIQKVKLIENALERVDSISFFVQILWELRLISNSQYNTLGTNIEGIGKMLGGWRKSLIIKTSAK